MNREANGIERRTAPRYGCGGDAEIVVPGRGLSYQGKIGNLSVGGCFLEVQCALERGTSVEIWMNASGQPLRVAANLLARRENGAGFRFHSLTPRKLEQIRSLIAELEQSAAEAEKADPSNEGDTAGVLERIEKEICGHVRPEASGAKDRSAYLGIASCMVRWVAQWILRRETAE
jgi:hypothetical protein